MQEETSPTCFAKLHYEHQDSNCANEQCQYWARKADQKCTLVHLLQQQDAGERTYSAFRDFHSGKKAYALSYGLPIREICDLLEVGQGTPNWAEERALEKLRKRLINRHLGLYLEAELPEEQ